MGLNAIERFYKRKEQRQSSYWRKISDRETTLIVWMLALWKKRLSRLHDIELFMRHENGKHLRKLRLQRDKILKELAEQRAIAESEDREFKTEHRRKRELQCYQTMNRILGSKTIKERYEKIELEQSCTSS